MTRLSLAAFALLGHAFILLLALTAFAGTGERFVFVREALHGRGYNILLKVGLPLLAFAP